MAAVSTAVVVKGEPSAAELRLLRQSLTPAQVATLRAVIERAARTGRF